SAFFGLPYIKMAAFGYDNIPKGGKAPYSNQHSSCHSKERQSGKLLCGKEPETGTIPLSTFHIPHSISSHFADGFRTAVR
ncbi:MAG: hypothetical protein VZR73_03900, partial [Acutalibacteraceae bacterium]|nr:hypothetical protein [Acutalibacteraceae bacterium]